MKNLLLIIPIFLFSSNLYSKAAGFMGTWSGLKNDGTKIELNLKRDMNKGQKEFILGLLKINKAGQGSEALDFSFKFKGKVFPKYSKVMLTNEIRTEGVLNKVKTIKINLDKQFSDKLSFSLEQYRIGGFKSASTNSKDFKRFISEDYTLKRVK